jgi:SAM-dependent methyltransferase
VITTHPRPTGERPQQGVTPPSLLALHDAGYRQVAAGLGPGTVLDVGCGQGFESVRLAAEGRRVVGVDYSEEAVAAAARITPGRLVAARMDVRALGIAAGAVDWVCSSHVIEHFADPAVHASEAARVLADGGTAFFLTPNAPADFENPFHLVLFEPASLGELLGRFFEEVWVGGIDAPPEVKAEFAARRAKARRLLALDIFGLRHRMPRRWYVAVYARLLPIAYRLTERGGKGDVPAAPEGWFVTEHLDETTLVLFAVCRGPRRPGRPESPAGPANPANPA